MTGSAAAGTPAPKGRSRRSFAGARPVMDDVARMAGVSKQTVSRVLNGHPAVRPSTREAVTDAIRTLGYRPSRSARSLASGRTRMLGVISFDAARFGPASILAAVNAGAQEEGYLVSSIALDSTDPGTVARAAGRLSSEGAEGVIVIAPQEQVGDTLGRAGLDGPVVAVDSDPGDGSPWVMADSATGARLATEHLLGLGHRTVHHIAGPSGWAAADRRAAGWRAALEEAGAPVPPSAAGDWSADSGYALGRRIADDPEATAVFASNDQMALGLLRALYEAGRRVPDDVSVVGCDDIPEAAHFLPPLTTVRTDFAALGARALRLLTERIDSADRPDGPDGHAADPVVLPVELVVRSSTGPPRTP
ncbi:LacI family DNA-binding transcriptional regulator [Nocardiopsis sp. RSe5-2]|uniref:LacI family DNA-binding transcriptional regulator n=1 Tax=Nocardiopsis endophytica TaxID=3018445 RepID=A0ABT4U950_9ACTN|nr:LacI family DNA-binding transcriptional regulator [Nocardiopsis endophytica]MDA2813476.1 LacI family DNA-binding transcriptional regulator [Nocardiopsis endophytica]